VLGIWVAGRSPVIALTMFDLDKYAYSTLRAGASGFLLKDVLPGRLPYGVALTSP
jgi:DNA-binding NarL/FixJ family response regulator